MELSTRKIAIALLVAYGMLLVGNAAFAWSWSGDLSQIPPLVFRLALVAVMGWGLAHRQRWAWWLTVAFSALLVPLGLLAVGTWRASGELATRPHPQVDLAVLLALLAILALAGLCLLLPSARRDFFPPGA